MYLSIDVVPVPKDLATKVLQKKYLGIESDIIKQQRVRNKNNDFSTEISYAKRTEKKEIEEIMDDVRENDQCLFFVGVTIILMAESKKELESVCEAGTTQRDVVRHGVVSIPVSFSVTKIWLTKLGAYAKKDKIQVQYFDPVTAELVGIEMYVYGFKVKLEKDTSYKGFWTVSFTLREM